MKPRRIEGPRLVLRDLTVDDVTSRYVAWMNDPEVNRYTESRFTTHTIESVRDFVAATAADPANVFLAIERKDDGRHIGNIKLGPIHPYHRSGDIGLLIGEKDAWGHGFATEAIGVLKNYAFAELGLAKLTAGCYANNPGSLKAFLKAGFSTEGKRLDQYRFGDQRIDLLLVGCANRP
jgi:RimJ/RimL family protein N-acetyltransferase